MYLNAKYVCKQFKKIIIILHYFQMVDEINRGYINPKDKLYQLKALQESNKQIEVSS